MLKFTNDDVVFHKSGNVNVKATTDKFSGALEAHITDLANEAKAKADFDATLAKEVATLVQPGKWYTMPYLMGVIAAKLGTPEQFTELSEKVAEYIRANSKDEDSSSLYQVTKGQGRGVSLRTVKTEAA
jgi:hypothetical protein